MCRLRGDRFDVGCKENVTVTTTVSVRLGLLLFKENALASRKMPLTLSQGVEFEQCLGQCAMADYIVADPEVNAAPQSSDGWPARSCFGIANAMDFDQHEDFGCPYEPSAAGRMVIVFCNSQNQRDDSPSLLGSTNCDQDFPVRGMVRVGNCATSGDAKVNVDPYIDFNVRLNFDHCN